MAKYLVGTGDGKVRSQHDSLEFSIAGKYVVDVPYDVDVTSDSLTDLLAAKVAAFKDAHPNLAYDYSDELITAPNVDSALSYRYMKGIDKRTSILPGGYVVTDLITVVNSVTLSFIHWHGFTLYSDPGEASDNPPPPRLLYNYDPDTSSFFDFDPDTFSVVVRDSTDTSTLLAVNPDAEQDFFFSPGDVRLRFTNNSTKVFHLSDWIMLLDG